MASSHQAGALRRFFGWLFSPSGSLSVFVLLLVGVVVGAVGVIGTQVGIAMSGTTEFCGTTCHSHEKFVYPDHKLSVHYTNRTGVRPACTDCHVPHSYPAKLFYKAKAGLVDAFAELNGTISTQQKFDKERWRLANIVWDEMKADNSANCRSCHNPQAWNPEKQSEDARKAHKKFFSGKATCIECHTGVAHKDVEDPGETQKAAAPK